MHSRTHARTHTQTKTNTFTLAHTHTHTQIHNELQRMQPNADTTTWKTRRRLRSHIYIIYMYANTFYLPLPHSRRERGKSGDLGDFNKPNNPAAITFSNAAFIRLCFQPKCNSFLLGITSEIIDNSPCFSDGNDMEKCYLKNNKLAARGSPFSLTQYRPDARRSY